MCSHCRRLGKPCQYPTGGIEVGLAVENDQSSTTDPGQDSALYLSTLRSQIDAVLVSTDEVDPDLAHLSPLIRKHAVESLEHFLQCNRSWLKTPYVQSVMQRQAASDHLLHEPHLFHAVLAVSTAHIAVLKPDDESYGLASAVHSQRSLRLYTECLNSDFGEQNIDRLYFTTHILSMLAFNAIQHEHEPQQWQLPPFVEPMRGMAVLQNLPHVGPRLRAGVWQSSVRSCEVWHQRVRDRLRLGINDCLSPALVALRSYSNSLPPEEAGFYNERIDMLGILDLCSSEPRAINAICSFVGRAPVEYITKLRNGEEMALLLLLYWSQLLSKCNQWWLTSSARLLSSRLYTHIYCKASSDRIRSLVTIIATAQSNNDGTLTNAGPIEMMDLPQP